MKNKKIALILIVAIVAIISSCTTFSMSGVAFQEDSSKYKVVGEFDKKIWVHEFLGTPGGANLFNITAKAMDDAIASAIAVEVNKLGGDCAIDVDVKYKASFWNLVISSLTGSIYAPGTAHISGKVAVYK